MNPDDVMGAPLYFAGEVVIGDVTVQRFVGADEIAAVVEYEGAIEWLSDAPDLVALEVS